MRKKLRKMKSYKRHYWNDDNYYHSEDYGSWFMKNKFNDVMAGRMLRKQTLLTETRKRRGYFGGNDRSGQIYHCFMKGWY